MGALLLQRSARRATAWGVLVAFTGLLNAGCSSATRSTPRNPDEVEMGLKRGASWTTFTLKRGRIVGSTASLEIRRGKIRGFLDKQPVQLEASPTELSGYAGGRVQLDIEDLNGKLEIAGTWNGERVRVEITPETLRGQVTGQPLGHCQFVLDKIDPVGVRTGSSICSGMPEDTLLDFPRDVEKWLTRGEAVAVLLALLSSAPPSMGDAALSGSRF
jgi:hypothetical protein